MSEDMTPTELARYAAELGKTVRHLSEILELNPNYIEEERRRREEHAQSVEAQKKVEASILAELRAKGINLSSLDDYEGLDEPLSAAHRIELMSFLGRGFSLSSMLLERIARDGPEPDVCEKLISTFDRKTMGSLAGDFGQAIHDVAHPKNSDLLYNLFESTEFNELRWTFLRGLIRVHRNKNLRLEVLTGCLTKRSGDLSLLETALELISRHRVVVPIELIAKHSDHPDEDIRRLARRLVERRAK